MQDFTDQKPPAGVSRRRILLAGGAALSSIAVFAAAISVPAFQSDNGGGRDIGDRKDKKARKRKARKKAVRKKATKKKTARKKATRKKATRKKAARKKAPTRRRKVRDPTVGQFFDWFFSNEK